MARRTAAEVSGQPAAGSRQGAISVRQHYGRHVAAVLARRLLILAVVFAPLSARAGALDEMALDRWAKLREAERYQLNIAEKYYRENNWKVALAEYEKFLTLYEASEGAPYAQLKWSNCLVQLRKVNTAIKDGYQSVIDYWPESPEAVAASYLIARSYKTMGETKAAKKAYAAVLADHSEHVVGTLARVDLIDIARVENDTPRRVALWRELVFNTERKGEKSRPCVEASRDFAVHSFQNGAFAEGLKSLATTYQGPQLPPHVMQYILAPLQNLAAQADTKAKGEKVADEAIAWMRQQIPTDLKDEAQKTLARQYWFYLADLEGAAGRTDKVPQVYDQMAKVFGNDDAILGRLATWYKSQNRRDEARSTYLKFNNKIEGRSNLAAMHREEKQYDQAVAIYQQLAGEDQEKAAQWQAATATTYREAGKPDQAIAVYQQLLTQDAKNANNWQWHIAITYRDFGKLKEAIASFRLCDNFPEAYQQMASCHRQLKEFKEAILLYNQILGSHPPTAPWALLQIGYTQEQAGDKESAIKTLQQVCKRFPKTGQASEAHVHLNEKYKITVTLGGATEE